MSVTGNQIKAGRILAELEQVDLADAAEVSVNTIRNMEARGSEVVRVRLDTVIRVGNALRRHGVILMDDGDRTDGGVGVRLRDRADED
ncbi:transcriptional regulator [Aminobacter sp. Y103A]|nr:transcriptional regulator [Aminobacter sp. SS-2016]